MTPELQSLNDRICILIGRVKENGENLQRELDALKALAETGTAQNTGTVSAQRSKNAKRHIRINKQVAESR